MNALEFMTKFERECLSFYETLNNGAKEREDKELYAILVDTQKSHLTRLEEIIGKVRGSDAESELLERAGSLDYNFHKLLIDHELIKAMRRDSDAFEHVVKMEEDVIRLFEGVARVEKRETTRQLLAMLAENEKQHLAEIEGIYDFVEKPRSYLEWGEFSNLKSL